MKESSNYDPNLSNFNYSDKDTPYENDENMNKGEVNDENMNNNVV
jgi:hypothetical protein